MIERKISLRPLLRIFSVSMYMVDYKLFDVRIKSMDRVDTLKFCKWPEKIEITHTKR